jgi:hypothetical protein
MGGVARCGVARSIDLERQPTVREQAAQFREAAAAVIHASWKVEWWRSLLFGMGAGVVLALVGAFGTSSYPLLQRLPVFSFIGAGSGLIVAGCIAAISKIRWLDDRPIARRLAVSLAMAPLSALWVWLVISFVYLGKLNLWGLVVSLGYTALLAGPMALISWLVFRPRVIHAAKAQGPLKFMERLPFRLRDGELYAVEAEDHYLRVRTSKGSDLILMRLSDALLELEGVEGVQTHRSWWVAKVGVADVRRTGGRAVVVLKDGCEAPVSRTYARALRASGWI